MKIEVQPHVASYQDERQPSIGGKYRVKRVEQGWLGYQLEIWSARPRFFGLFGSGGHWWTMNHGEFTARYSSVEDAEADARGWFADHQEMLEQPVEGRI